MVKPRQMPSPDEDSEEELEPITPLPARLEQQRK